MGEKNFQMKTKQYKTSEREIDKFIQSHLLGRVSLRLMYACSREHMLYERFSIFINERGMKNGYIIWQCCRIFLNC